MKGQASKVRKLAKMVIEQTGGGRALVTFLMMVANGDVEGVSIRDRLEASKILLDRGWGKAPLQIEVSGTVTHVPGRIDMAKFSDDELASLRKTLRRGIVSEQLPAVTEEIEDADVEP